MLPSSSPEKAATNMVAAFFILTILKKIDKKGERL
jgi:hypothetical protein